MFYLSYIGSELRRRAGRTLLTALGLGVGVGLVVAVSALSRGLDQAQDEVLAPLTGVGTDMTVSRPLNPDADGGGLSERERRRLREENGGPRIGLREVGEPGERFSRTDFLSAQLSFPAATVDDIRALDGVSDAAGSLTLDAVSVSGEVPQDGGGAVRFGAPAPGGPGGGPQSIDLESMSVTGVDVSRSELAVVGPSEVVEGEYLDGGSERQAVLSVSFAERNDLGVGDHVKLKGKRFEVVGIARAPLGGQASDVYVGLEQLQAISDRKGRVNSVQVRAGDADTVPAVEKAITRTLDGASVTTAADLAERIGGSLSDARELADRLGLALTVVALVAAFLIASLLTLSSVTKRVRELGTLKALGWPARKVVRQVTGESIAQGALGGLLGAGLGIAAAAAVSAAGFTLDATVAAAETARPGRFIGPAGAFGQGSVEPGSTSVALEAPVDLRLVGLAIGLALLGGVVAGAVGGLRAARLRPVDALRHIG